MTGGTIRFGAVATKIKAMYAKRLTPEDFTTIAAMRGVPEVVSYLKEHPGWRRAFDGSFDETRRGPLEAGLRRYLMSEYLRILHYIDKDDRFITYDRVLRTDMEQIMLFLRYAQSGRTSEYRADLPAQLLRHSHIDYGLLSKSNSYNDMLEAVKNVRYYGALSRLPAGEDGFPDYTSVEMIMRNHYYHALMEIADKRYRGRTHALLRRAVGELADIVNITIIMRVRKYFPEQLDAVVPMLLPVRYKLSPAFVNRLYTAKTDEAAEELLRTSPYGKVFSAQQVAHIEEYYYQFIYDFNRRVLAGPPNVYTPAAYLSLRDVELKNLISAIECVRYGVHPEKSSTYLFGIPL